MNGHSGGEIRRASLISLPFAQRLQAEKAFNREQADGLAEQIYASLYGIGPEPCGLKKFIDAGITQQQAEALINYTADYVVLFRGTQNV